MASLHVPAWGWAAVLAGLVVFLSADLVASARRKTPVRMSEAAGWALVTVLLAVGFCALLAVTSGGTAAGQFFAGWLTEYSLSLDNLMVFVILISRSRVPAALHGRVLLAGIGIAVVLRGIVIGLGAAALNRFGWLEFLFAGFLLYTAAQIARRSGTPIAADAGTGQFAGAPEPASAGGLPGTGGAPVAPGAPEQEPPQGVAARLAGWLTRRHGSVPVLALVIALGVVDVMFALDSIPAIFGLTRDPFLVFSANVFALIGLRHLYFLVAGLLARLVYLQAGLCIILAFIGAKLLGEALHEVGVTSIGPVPVPHVSSWLSLVIIVLVLAATALASVLATRRRARKAELHGRAAYGGEH